MRPEMQEQVLGFVSSLGDSAPAGESGASLRRFAGLLDAASAREIAEAVEDHCERVDLGEW
jgi:hypothetical protein